MTTIGNDYKVNNNVGMKKTDSSVSNPNDYQKVLDLQQQRELASKECAYATKATAMAQILMGTSLKFNTTPDEYVAQLMKQGKVPNKNFNIEKINGGTIVTETNMNGEKTKDARFWKLDDGSARVDCNFYNPKTQKDYKSIEYHQDGGILISNQDPITGIPQTIDLYRADGSIEYHRDIDTMTETNISKNGAKTTYKMLDENGNRIDRFFDDDGNKICEKLR